MDNGYKLMHAPKDVTVTAKLSGLQKRILVHARQSMLTKEQSIDAATEVTLCLRAPPWLDQVLCEAMRGITKARQGYVLKPGPDAIFLSAVHPWMKLFQEMTFLREQIEAAAEAAGVKSKINLTQLYKLALPTPTAAWMFALKVKSIYEPWPYVDDRGWYFKLTIKEMSLDRVKADLLKDIPESRAWAYDDSGSVPLNCTIPELLRDLFGFPVQGHIDALAFSVEDIGADRYNAAQASLRRAWNRLRARGLINIRSGQRSPSVSIFTKDDYTRTGIGLTQAGVAVAETLHTR